MSIQKNIELSPFTTFGVTCVADSLVRIQSVEELVSFMEGYDGSSENLLILGGGSNILFTRPFHGLVIKNEIRGIELIEENDEHYFVRVGAGEVWHDFVMHAIAQNWAGVENLSLIPGCAGAAPMQNIGAYGVEIGDVLTAVRAYHIPSKEVRTIAAEDCELAYRESIFKHKVKGEYVIVSIDLKLNKNPEFKTSYGAIQDELKRMGVTELNIRDISTAVINIRKSKLPDPQEIGNAGSFFKNPVVNPEKLAELQKAYPDIPHRPKESVAFSRH